MNLRLPPSRLFCSITACAVVPEPAKKSRIVASFLRFPFTANEIKWRISSLGFENLKTFSEPNISLISFVPSWVNGPFMIDRGLPLRISPFSSIKYFLARTEYVPSFCLLNSTSLFSMAASRRSLLHTHCLRGWMISPLYSMGYIRLGLSPRLVVIRGCVRNPPLLSNFSSFFL